MATVVRHQLAGCEGFRLEAPQGLVGWVEERWLGAADEPVALAIRLIDGRDGLLLAEDVEAVVAENELLVVRGGGRLLGLDVPHVQTASPDGLSASWRTTGELLELPDPPRLVDRTLLGIRPWRLASPPEPAAERPLWLTLVEVYAAITVIVGLLIGLDFLVAWLTTGSSY